jgi:hypothetical protein
MRERIADGRELVVDGRERNPEVRERIPSMRERTPDLGTRRADLTRAEGMVFSTGNNDFHAPPRDARRPGSGRADLI